MRRGLPTWAPPDRRASRRDLGEFTNESERDVSVETGAAGAKQHGHGWWPYLLPYFGFMVIVQIAAKTPASWSLAMLVVKPAVPGLLILFFFSRGAYAELRGYRPGLGRVLQNIAVGVGLTAVWMGPYFLVDALPRPAPEEGFDPLMAGESGVALVLGLRMLGYALVTPLFEEIFIRSWLLRYIEVFDTRRDFRDVPIAHFDTRSFIVTSIFFTLGHMMWEWPVAIVWVLLSNLWFYRQGHLMDVVIVHATTNATILAVVALGALALGWDPGALWIFV
jgi:CAAX prenyl protease-like protein